MKKRVVFSILITLLIVFLSNKIWFIIRPMPVSLDIHGKNSVNVEVQLNKKDNDEFDKIKSESVEVNLDEKSHIDFQVERAKYPKRIRFVFLNIDNGSVISISNIRLKKDELVLDNLDKFIVEGANKEIKNNQLILYPFQTNVKVTYPDTLNIHTDMEFDYMLLIIMIIMLYLLIYKLLNYVISYKSIKDKSFIEIAFLLIFFTVLFIPMSKINDEEISVKENRTLAKLTPLVNNNKFNFDFGKEYDTWFNDRFFMRDTILNMYKSLIYKLTYKYYAVGGYYINKRTNYMDLKDINSKGIYSQELFEDISSNIVKLQKFCKKNNIKLYILISPAKATFPSELGEPLIKKNSNAIYRQETKELISKIEAKTGQKIFYPYDEMLELSKHTNAFFKADHHWTDDGAYIAYSQVMKAAQKDVKGIRVSQPDDFNYTFSNLIRVEPNTGFFNGATYNALGLNDTSVLDTQYRYYTYKKSDNIISWTESHIQDAYEYLNYVNNNNVNAPNGILFGDSTTLNLLPMLPSSFYKFTDVYTWVGDSTKVAERFNIKQYEKEILKNKPSVLIFCSFDIGRLSYLYKDDEN